MKKIILLTLIVSFNFFSSAHADQDLQDYGDQAPSHTNPGVSGRDCNACDLNSTNPLPESLLTQDTNTTDIARVNDALGSKNTNSNKNNGTKSTK